MTLASCLGKEVTTDEPTSDVSSDVTSDATLDGQGGPPEVTSDVEPMKPPANDGRFFDTQRVYEVRITLAPEDWDTLRNQTRTLLDILGGEECLAEPVASPFTWFSADVLVDGIEVTKVGVRKKGFLGSLDDVRPSLKVKLDEFVDDQNLDGLTRLTLNNARQDPSKVNQCMSYELYAQVGVPAPRCSYVHLYVNEVDMGLYVNVESIKKDFLRRHFDHDDGNLYEGALSDFREGWLGTFERKTNKSDLDRSDLDAIAAAAAAPDGELMDRLTPLVHMDRFFSMWAVDVLINHVDGYAQNTNNFYIYRDLDGRFTFIPWGADNTLIWNPEEQRPPAVMATGIVSHRLYRSPETQQTYIARLQEVLETVWDEEALLAELDRQQALIAPHVLAEEQDAMKNWLDLKRDFITTQRERITASLTPTAPFWDVPLREPPCLVEHGTINAAFDTTWGTLPVEDIFSTGTGAIATVVDGAPWQVVATGSKAGSENLGEARIIVAGALEPQSSPGGIIVLVVTVPQQRWVAGTPLPLGFGPGNGQIYRFFEGAQEPEFLGFLLEGTLNLEAAGATSGAAVKGNVSSPFYRFGP